MKKVNDNKGTFGDHLRKCLWCLSMYNIYSIPTVAVLIAGFLTWYNIFFPAEYIDDITRRGRMFRMLHMRSFMQCGLE